MKRIEDKVVYQIYPMSFQDSNNDGIGDLQGIISRLDDLKDLGVDTLWISPIYPSPGNDNGYDVSDYRAIDPKYGTMEDFDELIREAGNRGIGIMMDMVFNHTSTEHEWFQKALAGDPVYKDYYIWKDARPDGSLPTNWVSKFGGPAWEYAEKFDQYYLHLFDVSQADLNWENPRVRQEAADIVRFWMDRGVKGFRFDVVNLISKAAYENDEIWDGRRFYTDGPRIHEFLQELNENSFGQDAQIITVGEMSSTDLDHARRYAAKNGHELDMVFSFHHLKVDYENREKWSLKKPDLKEFRNLLFDWQTGMQETDSWNALFLNCHDQPRSLSRFGNDREYRRQSAKALANLMHMLRGTPYIFQGEEIGMKNPDFTDISQYRDVESLNAWEILKEKGVPEEERLQILHAKSRDDARTPVQWNASEHFGFTRGTPWIAGTPDEAQWTLEAEKANPDSVWNHYRKLIALRKEHQVIQDGEFIPLPEEKEGVIAYLRRGKGEEALVITSLLDKEAEFTLPDAEDWKMVLSSYDDGQEASEHMHLRPYESGVYLRPVRSEKNEDTE